MTRSSTLIQLAKARDGNRCVRCSTCDNLQGHHVHALADGGTDTLDNITTLCGTCHDGWHLFCEGWLSFGVYMSEPFKRDINSAHSQRTKEALQAAKARGVKLGGYRGHQADWSAQARLSGQIRAQRATEYARDLAGAIDRARADGATSLKAIADHLNGAGITTAKGGQWSPTQVKRVLDRLEGSPQLCRAVTNPATGAPA